MKNRSIWKKWLRNPLRVGTIRPSSRGLARLMVEQIPKGAKVIVEFGAGTGPITVELSKKFPEAQIFCFELDKDLAKKVQERVPSVQVIPSDVTEAPFILPEKLVGKVDAVVSSLPLLNISAVVNKKILESAFKILRPQASFVQFTYFPFLPPVRIYKKMGLWSQFNGMELRNLPPAYVWSFRKIDF